MKIHCFKRLISIIFIKHLLFHRVKCFLSILAALVSGISLCTQSTHVYCLFFLVCRFPWRSRMEYQRKWKMKYSSVTYPTGCLSYNFEGNLWRRKSVVFSITSCNNKTASCSATTNDEGGAIEHQLNSHFFHGFGVLLYWRCKLDL